ncbi:hypothetical protein RB596_009078 [Gaeumannomyces avenae]
MSVLVESFSREQIETGLRWLDRAIEQSEVLDGVLPINLVSYGGVLSVCLFDIRPATKDVDVLLPPNIRDAQPCLNEFKRLVASVADDLGYMRDWVNDDLRLFVPTDHRLRLLQDSIEQGVTVFEGSSLVIWAGVWEFGLESKLHRIGQNSGNTKTAKRRREADISDAVELVHRMRGHSANPLDKAWVMGLKRYDHSPSFEDEAIEQVSRHYISRYAKQGIVELVLDAAEGRRKYQDLAGQWVWFD